MDLQKIGAFLAQLRKDYGWTQEQLGEKLGVTNKTVSRWEQGNYLPPVEMLHMLSDFYGLTINELLSGQRLEAGEYRQKAEENICTALESSFTLKEKIPFYRKKWEKDHFASNLLLMIPAAALLIWGGVRDDILYCMAGALYGLVMITLRRNAMMAYVDDRAFDGSSVH